MTKNLLILGTALFAFACTDGKDSGIDTGDGGTTDGGSPDGGGTLALTMDCEWAGGGLEVTLTGGDLSGYSIGLAETDCGGQCWTGEDCVYGYVASNGTSYNYCHPASSSGVFLETVGSFDGIIAGSTTIHSASLNNTYFMEEESTGTCWIWGYDTSYYGGLGCTDIGGGCTGE